MIRAETVHLRAIHGLGKLLGLDHAALSDIVQGPEMYGKRLSGINEVELREFRTWLQKQTRTVQKQIPPGGTKPAWTKQDKRIFKLGFILGWNNKDLRGFFNRVVKKRELRGMSTREKSAVIIGLQKVIDARANKQHTDSQ